MSREKILGYKLSYCLGVPNSMLKELNRDIYDIVESIGYFKDKRSINIYRSISSIYFSIVKHYNSYANAPSFLEVAGDRYAGELIDFPLNIEEEFIKSKSLDKFLNFLSDYANNFLPKVYSELEIDVPFGMYYNLFSLPSNQDEKAFMIMKYFLNRKDVKYNIYFWWHWLLNINIDDILSSDRVLTKRLSVITGTECDLFKDKSVLSSQLRVKDDKFFIRRTELGNYTYIVVDDSKIPELTVRKLKGYFGDKIILNGYNILDEERFMERKNYNRDNTVFISAISDNNIAFIRDVSDYIPVVLRLPVPKDLYAKILKGEYPNIRMLSYK